LLQASMVSQRKTDLLGVAQAGAQFIQLQMREAQGAQETLVQGLRVSGSARQKGS
jgi:hypothetical protein